jgi:glycosyltransferase involved in cell wall biosynthesis
MPGTVVLIPTFDHVETLRLAIASAVTQTVSDLDVHVIGDGAPMETDRLMDELCERYPQVRYHPHEKSPRTGEPYRDQLLRKVDAAFVCYLADDNVWTPDHVELLTGALVDHDFAATLSMYCRPGTEVLSISRMQFADPTDRGMEMHQSRVSLTESGHRLDSYLRLPFGWRTTPAGEYTDHWMWKQWLEQPWVRATTVQTITTVHLPDFMRRGVPLADRLAEQQWWFDRVNDPDWPLVRGQLLTDALWEGFEHADRGLVHFRRHAARLEADLTELRSDLTSQERSHAEDAQRTAEQLRLLEAELEHVRSTLRTISGSRTWRYGQAAARITRYGALRGAPRKRKGR